MNAEAAGATHYFMPTESFLGGAAKAWEEVLNGYYRGMMDVWIPSSNPFVTAPDVKVMPEDFARLSGLIWKSSCDGMATMQDRMEAFNRLAMSQQETSREIYQAFADCVRRVSAAGQNGGLEAAFRACLESHGGILESVESAVQDETKALFELWRAFIPRQNRTPKAAKQKAS